MIKVVHGDITSVSVDAIVNAAKPSLLGGSGVDGAIHRIGGPQILEDCLVIHNRQGGCKIGEAVITRAGNLPAKFVIHAVGPVWVNGNNNEDALLTSAYHFSLQIAAHNSIKRISFPNISTGRYHFPKERAAHIAISTVQAFLENDSRIQEVIFVCFDAENYLIYQKILRLP
jgi:O-acetyl-ADP-ribose deacetylase (regulator of RNase III)